MEKLNPLARAFGTGLLVGGLALALIGCAGTNGQPTSQEFRQQFKQSSLRSRNLREVWQKENNTLRIANETKGYDKGRQIMGYGPGADVYFVCAVGNTHSRGGYSLRDEIGFRECLMDRGYPIRR